MGTTNNGRVAVGEIENLANWLHRVVPIRSFRQLVSVLAAAGLVSLGFFIIFRAVPPGAVVVGMLLGMCPFLEGVLPSRFRIDIAENSRLKGEIFGVLEHASFRFGYKNQSVVDGVVIMKPKRPRFLVWDENTVRLSEQGDAIVIEGPLVTTSVLRRRVLKQFNLE
jgi:hypothetical protein